MRRKLIDNLKRVQQRIEEACAKTKRDPSSVTLVAVTKSASVDIIRALIDLGVTNLGESRPQELVQRAGMINELMNRSARGAPSDAPRPQWHMIGHLQRNKVKAVLPWTDLIHSVDSLRLAEEIDSQSARLERVTPILLEVNAGGEAAKSGVAVVATAHLVEQLATLKHIEVRGLMAMAPLTEDAMVIRRTFERVRELFEEIVDARLYGAAFRELSLGMSQDFEYGIEAGATYVRIGSALFEGIEVAAASLGVD